MDSLFIYIILLFVSFIFALMFTPKFIKLTKQRGYTGTDMNKLSKSKVSELGGLPVFLSFILTILFSLLALYFMNGFSFSFFNILDFLLILFSFFLVFFMGFIDDVLGWKKGISQFQHFLFPIFFSIPIVILSLMHGFNSFYFPILGTVSVGLVYSLVLVPIAMTATTNAFNLFAGYNGLETGLGIIILSTISVFAYFENNLILFFILASFIGSLLGFYKFNKYPSKVFPGDIITLLIGFLAGVSAIYLKLEAIVFFLIIIYILEFIIKLIHKFKTECFGIVDKKGIIHPKKEGGSLTHLILSIKPFTERSFVSFVFILQILISIISILFYFY